MKRSYKKILVGMMAATMLFAVGCGDKEDGAADTAISGEITVVSREDGSGTRGAFIELTGVEQKDANGNREDLTTDEAIIASKTDVMLTNIANAREAIGYISLGSLNDKVKAVKIDGVEASAANIANGSYALQRPFNVAVKGEGNAAVKDFINYIMSAEGQSVIEENGYIKVDEAAKAFTSTKPTGKITVGGSSSVSPVMEKLIEAYHNVNANLKIELQTNDSTSGMQGTMEGTYDIGMASRELKDSEASELTGTAIAKDGIAVIVNNGNPISDISKDMIRKIYTGEVTDWEEVK